MFGRTGIENIFLLLSEQKRDLHQRIHFIVIISHVMYLKYNNNIFTGGFVCFFIITQFIVFCISYCTLDIQYKIWFLKQNNVQPKAAFKCFQNYSIFTTGKQSEIILIPSFWVGQAINLKHGEGETHSRSTVKFFLHHLPCLYWTQW